MGLDLGQSGVGGEGRSRGGAVSKSISGKEEGSGETSLSNFASASLLSPNLLPLLLSSSQSPG